jgi:4-hydroxy-3-methylbut-2-enyl diphosphate reductase
MKVILASPRGFCAGVNMAIESLDLAIQAFGTPVYVYHEIVHNKYVVQTFQRKGAVFVDDLAEVPPGSLLLFSAHGVAPEVRRVARERRLHAIDATCPLVTKVHLEAIRFAKEGYTILLVGHAGHDEVLGTMGEAPASIQLVESEQDVERLSVAPETKLAYLTQTTLSVDDAERIIARLRQRFPRIVGPPKGGYLLRDAESPGGGPHPVARIGRGAGVREPEQLEQPTSQRISAGKQCRRIPDRRR